MTHAEMLELAGSLSDHEARVTEFEPAVVAALKIAQPGDTFIELGVRQGGSTLLTAWHLMHAHHTGAFYSVDQADQPPALAEQIAQIGYPNWRYVQSLQRPFLISELVRAAPVAYCNFDADHNYDPVVDDMRSLVPYLRDGAILTVDDVNEWSRLPDIDGLEQVFFDVDQGGVLGQYTGIHVAFYRKIPRR
jgi:cephalosporin hydroxylase